MARGPSTAAALAVLVALCAAAAVPVAHAANYTLSLAYTAGVRGEFIDDSCSPSQLAGDLADDSYECKAAMSRVVSFLRSFRDGRANPLVLEGGSFFFGSLFYVRFEEEASGFFFNASGYDAALLGTSDFYGGAQALDDYLAEIGPGAPAVATNLAVSGLPSLAARIAPWRVVDVSGRLVGVLSTVKRRVVEISAFGQGGAVNATTSPGGLTQTQQVAVALHEMRVAHPGVDIVVLFYRQNDVLLDGADEGFAFARDIRGIDIVVTIADNGGARADAPAPERRTNLFGEPLMVTSRELDEENVATLDVVFGDDGLALDASGAVVAMDGAVPEDGGALAALAVFADELTAFTDSPIGTVASGAAFDEERCRNHECAPGRVITDAILDRCGGLCDFAVINSGSIRGGLPAGTVTTGDVLSMLPFGDYLQVVRMPGRAVIEMLQHSVDWGSPSGKFLQFAGLQVAINPARDGGGGGAVPLANRLLEVNVKRAGTSGHPSSAANFVPLDTGDEVFYTFAAPSFMVAGNDGFDMIPRDGELVLERITPDLQVVAANYIGAEERTSPDPAGCEDGALAGVPIAPEALECRLLENSAVDNVDIFAVCPTDEEVCLSSARVDIFALPAATAEDCRRCTGLGQCNNVACVCSVPESGHFRGFAMTRGLACDEVRSRDRMWELGLFAVFGITVLSAIVLVASISIVRSYRQHPIIRSASPLFLQFVNLGGILVVASVVALLLEPSRASCSSFAWLLATGTSLSIGGLLVKTYRIRAVFKSRLTKRAKLSNARLTACLAAVVAPNWLVLGLMQALSPLGTKAVVHDSTWTYELACGSDDGVYYVAALLAYNFLLLFATLVVAHSAKDVDDNFNESKFLMAALQNVAVVSGLAVVAFFSTYHTNISGRTLLLGLVINILLLGTHGILLASKVYAVKRQMFDFGGDVEDEVSDSGSVSGGESGGRNSGRSGSVSTVRPSVSHRARKSTTMNPRAAKRLAQRNQELEEEVITLRSKLMRAETRASSSMARLSRPPSGDGDFNATSSQAALELAPVAVRKVSGVSEDANEDEPSAEPSAAAAGGAGGPSSNASPASVSRRSADSASGGGLAVPPGPTELETSPLSAPRAMNRSDV